MEQRDEPVDFVVSGQQLPADTEEEYEDVDHNELARSDEVVHQREQPDQDGGKEEEQPEDGDRAQVRSSTGSIKTFSFQNQAMNQSCLEASAPKTNSNSRQAAQQLGGQQASKKSEGPQVPCSNKGAAAPQDLAERASRDARAAEHESSAINCGGTHDYSNDNFIDANAAVDQVES